MVLKAGECDITTTLMQDGEKVTEKTTHVKAFMRLKASRLIPTKATYGR